jgi:8-oxo-dGTP pyrophosphatase MutT (NUDIX family)
VTKRTVVVVKCLIQNEESFYLLLRRGPDERIDPGYLDLPGGKVRFGEDPIEALQREVAEEVGFEVRSHEPLLTWSRVIDDTHYVGILYAAKVRRPEVRLSDEHESYEWVELPTLLKRPLFEPIRAQLEGALGPERE